MKNLLKNDDMVFLCYMCDSTKLAFHMHTYDQYMEIMRCIEDTKKKNGASISEPKKGTVSEESHLQENSTTDVVTGLKEDNAIEVSDTKKDDTPEVVLNGQLGSDIGVTDIEESPVNSTANSPEPSPDTGVERRRRRKPNSLNPFKTPEFVETSESDTDDVFNGSSLVEASDSNVNGVSSSPLLETAQSSSGGVCDHTLQGMDCGSNDKNGGESAEEKGSELTPSSDMGAGKSEDFDLWDLLGDENDLLLESDDKSQKLDNSLDMTSDTDALLMEMSKLIDSSQVCLSASCGSSEKNPVVTDIVQREGNNDEGNEPAGVEDREIGQDVVSPSIYATPNGSPNNDTSPSKYATPSSTPTRKSKLKRRRRPSTATTPPKKKASSEAEPIVTSSVSSRNKETKPLVVRPKEGTKVDHVRKKNSEKLKEGNKQFAQSQFW